MNILDYVIIFIFMAAMVGVGFLFQAKSNSSNDEYLVGGRSLGTSVYVATWLATCIGGGVLNGWVGQVYTSGLALVPSMIVMYVLTAIIGICLAGKLRRSGLTTTAEVLKVAYGDSSQFIGGILGFINLFMQGPCMQTITFATVLNVITGVPFTYGCIISMAIILLYTYTAGFWGVAMTDFVQFIIMCIGVALGAIVCYNGVGGWSGIVAAVPADRLAVQGKDVMTIVKLAATTALPIIIDGNRYQRIYATDNDKTATKGTLLAIIPLHFFYMIILLLGTCAFILLPAETAQDAVFATLLLNYLPTGIKGLVFAALIAAIMSTCDSYLLCASSNITIDMYKNRINPNATDDQLLKISKASVLILGILGLLAAITLHSIMSAWSIAAAAFVGGCFVPMMYALFFDNARKSKIAANASMILGGGIGITLELMHVTVPFAGQNWPAVIVGTVISLVVLLVGTLLDKNAVARPFK